MKIIILSLMFTTSVFAINFDKQLNAINKEIVNIKTDELVDILNKNPNAILIDVRTEQEIDFVGTIAKGQNINIVRGWLEFRVDNFAKNAEIITYCGTNLRSTLAAKTLINMGFTNVKNYSDGFFEWQKRGLPTKTADNYNESFLYNEITKVADGVYSAIGATQPSTYKNSGHNNNLSFIIGEKSVLVFNAGGSYLLAKSLHNEIKKITNKPIKFVVIENAQGHAFLGLSYWKNQGVEIIAHKLADDEIKKHGADILERATQRLGDKARWSSVVRPDITFEHELELDLGNLKIKLTHLGASHSPDDIQLWIPSKKLLISGDTAFNERLLPVFEHTNIGEWIKTWDKIEALAPQIIIPGHGKPTDLKTITKFTKGYLQFMQTQIIKILDDDGSLNDAYKIDQSQFRDFGTYRELHLRNAARIFQQLEFEY